MVKNTDIMIQINLFKTSKYLLEVQIVSLCPCNETEKTNETWSIQGNDRNKNDEIIVIML